MHGRFPLVALAALSLVASGCQVLPERQGERSERRLPPPIDRSGSGQGAVPVTSDSDRKCLGNLAASGARFTRIPNRSDGPGCYFSGGLSLTELQGDRSRFTVTNVRAVQCTAANALSGWARYGVDRAAREYLGSGLARIETMGSYACRNVAGTSRRSGHSRAEAIDIAAFVLEDGRRVSVLDDWDGGSAAERRFLRRIQESACRRFGTVLGPDYNAAHRDHFHVETGGGGFCR